MPWARGGFLGVDAFFVLSGFLITSLLVAEWQRTGTAWLLGAFWARRARRLLPALLLVIGVLAVTAPMLSAGREVGRSCGRRARGALLRRELADDPARRRLLRPDRGTVAPRAHLVARRSRSSSTSSGRCSSVRACSPEASTRLVVALRRCTGVLRPRAVGVHGPAAGYDAMDPGAGLLRDRHPRGEPAHRRRPRGRARAYRPQAARLGDLPAGAPGARPYSLRARCWSWPGPGPHADGGDRWLYRGGLAGARSGRGRVVLAHVMLVPEGWLARLLALAPLVPPRP